MSDRDVQAKDNGPGDGEQTRENSQACPVVWLFIVNLDQDIQALNLSSACQVINRHLPAKT